MKWNEHALQRYCYQISFSIFFKVPSSQYFKTSRRKEKVKKVLKFFFLFKPNIFPPQSYSRCTKSVTKSEDFDVSCQRSDYSPLLTWVSYLTWISLSFLLYKWLPNSQEEWNIYWDCFTENIAETSMEYTPTVSPSPHDKQNKT